MFVSHNDVFLSVLSVKKYPQVKIENNSNNNRYRKQNLQEGKVQQLLLRILHVSPEGSLKETECSQPARLSRDHGNALRTQNLISTA